MAGAEWRTSMRAPSPVIKLTPPDLREAAASLRRVIKSDLTWLEDVVCQEEKPMPQDQEQF
jgi:hypothetical protein